MARRGGKRPNAGIKSGGQWMYIEMDPAQWKLLEKLRGVVNEKLVQAGRKPISVSHLGSVILTAALADNAGDIQDEAAKAGLDRLAVQLAPVFGADGLAAIGIPPISDRARARRTRARAAFTG